MSLNAFTHGKLNLLHTYCQKWKLEVNAKKTKIVIFSRGLFRKPPTWTFGDHKLDVVSDYTYLGVIFNYNGGFTKAIQKQIAQAKRASFSLVARIRKLSLPIDIQINLFDTCILPILLYGSEVWGFSNLKNVEVFQNQFFKHALKLHTKTPNAFVLGEVGKFKIEKYIKQRMLNFWINVSTGKATKISTILYNYVKNKVDKDESQSKWFVYIKNTLHDIDLGKHWDGDTSNELYCSMIQSASFKREIEKRLSNYYILQ